MPVKIEMTFREAIEYLRELERAGDQHKARDIANTLETDFHNIETRMKNAETELMGRREPLAVGSTPEECLRSFSQAQGLLTDSNDKDFEILENRKPKKGFTWDRDCYVGGDEFRGAGIEVPGGCILTWWR